MQPFWKTIGPCPIKLSIYPPSEPSFPFWLYIKKYGWLMCTKKTEIWMFIEVLFMINQTGKSRRCLSIGAQINKLSQPHSEVRLSSKIGNWLCVHQRRQISQTLPCAKKRRSHLNAITWRRKWQPTPVFLPGESPWTEESGRLQSMGSQRAGHDWATKHEHECN